MVGEISDANILREIGTVQNRAQTPPASPTNSSSDLPPDRRVEVLRAAVEKLIRRSMPANTKLRIDQDKETGTYIYRSVDKETGQVVRQWPPDELVKLRDSMRELEGMLLDHKA